MDTSETYIKMCERAEEIQDHGIADGDLYWWSVGSQVHLSFTETHLGHLVHHPEQWDFLSGRTIIWLPRQDQLQEMVGLWVNNRFGVMKILKKFYDFSIKDLTSDLTWSLYSMEQLWLAFVMKEKYSKVWKGEEWVNADF